MSESTTIDDGMTDAERQYLKTGEVTDALTHPQETPVDVDEHGEPEIPADQVDQGEQGDHRPRRIGFTKYQQELDARRAAEQQLHEQQVRSARIEERLSLLQQALQQPEQPEPEAPDLEKDIFGYVRYLEQQHAQVRDKVHAYEQQLATQQAEAEEDRGYINSLYNQIGRDPNFLPAYTFVMQSRALDLMGRKHPHATLEQLANMPIPQDVLKDIINEERNLYREGAEAGIDPSISIMHLARVRGWVPEQGRPGPAAQPGAATRSGPAVGQPRQQVPAGGRSASDIIAGIKNGQAAASSLSNVSGSAGGGLTPQALADMSDADFSTLFTALSERGDKQKLMELFGS